ncbi:ATP-dependent helicase fft1 [Yarrowia sp. B02]|nr:ATP-dependent helicase fft1 [Yarrowia sp. B02]
MARLSAQMDAHPPSTRSRRVVMSDSDESDSSSDSDHSEASSVTTPRKTKPWETKSNQANLSRDDDSDDDSDDSDDSEDGLSGILRKTDSPKAIAPDFQRHTSSPVKRTSQPDRPIATPVRRNRLSMSPKNSVFDSANPLLSASKHATAGSKKNIFDDEPMAPTKIPDLHARPKPKSDLSAAGLRRPSKPIATPIKTPSSSMESANRAAYEEYKQAMKPRVPSASSMSIASPMKQNVEHQQRFQQAGGLSDADLAIMSGAGKQQAGFDRYNQSTTTPRVNYGVHGGPLVKDASLAGVNGNSSAPTPEFNYTPASTAGDVEALLPYILSNNDDDDDSSDEEEQPEEKDKKSSSKKATSRQTDERLVQEKEMGDRSHLVRKHWDAEFLKNMRLKGIVPGLSVTLMQHQRRGVRWLLGREVPTNNHKGGMLCDDMGLGKTVQSISLILSNPRGLHKKVPSKEGEPRECKATLVIAPLSLATQWEQEIKDKSPGLRVLKHHGPGRTSDPHVFREYDVIVTTYQTLASEIKKDSSPLLGVKFWRVILDEAHTIKNKRSQMYQATCRVFADRRWCLTGTPVQNNIDELQALLQFIRVPPYDDPVVWKQHIAGPLSREGAARTAMAKLHLVLSGLMLRRTKAVLKDSKMNMKARRVHQVDIQFQPDERAFYDAVNDRIGSQIDTIANGSMMQALTLLLRLRQICDHRYLVSKEAATGEHLDEFEGYSAEADDGKDLDDLADMFADMGMDGTGSSSTSSGDNKVSINGKDVHASAKVVKLLELLKSDPRKTIVFSQFTKFFDVIEPFLMRENIRYVKYDGSMPIKKRDAALATLRTDPDTTVLLCSLKCGALGLNLTCANRVVLLDPWWNPMVSEQAIDRVHRIGQTVDVDVYEFSVADSVEKKIMQLQDKKRKLAGSVINGDRELMKEVSSLSRAELLFVFGRA